MNKWGETYSYSLTKGIVSGLPILYSNLGAYMERLGNNRKFFPIHDIHNIKPDMHVMLDMILENQEASVSNNVVPIEKDVPDLYRELFSRNNKDANLENKKFTVSVVIPNYNYEDFLAERLDSIVGQTYKPLEIIFLDDCSKDNTYQICKKHPAVKQIINTAFGPNRTCVKTCFGRPKCLNGDTLSGLEAI